MKCLKEQKVGPTSKFDFLVIFLETLDVEFEASPVPAPTLAKVDSVDGNIIIEHNYLSNLFDRLVACARNFSYFVGIASLS